MKIQKSLLTLVILILLISHLAAQTNISYITIEFGGIKNAKEFYPITGKDIFFYPKIGIGGDLGFDVFQWKLTLNYWEYVVRWNQNVGYNYSSHNVGFQLQLLTKELTDIGELGVKINAGASVHFYEAKYVNDLITSYRYKNFYSTIPYFDIGLELFYNLSEHWSPYISGEYHQHLKGSEINYFQPYSLAIGIAYRFN